MLKTSYKMAGDRSLHVETDGKNVTLSALKSDGSIEQVLNVDYEALNAAIYTINAFRDSGSGGVQVEKPL